MSQLEDLTRLIRWNCTATISDIAARDAAKAALAAGYSKPHTITTAEERASLAPGTVAVDANGNAWKRGTGSWVGTGDGVPLFDHEDLALTVLYEAAA